MGNHDWDGGVNNYTSYFTLPGNERYYSTRQGNVEIFVTKLTKNDAPSSGKVPPLPKGMEARSGKR